MSAEQKNDMKTDGAWNAVHEALNTEVPEHLENQLHETLGAFRQDLREHPYVRRLERHGVSVRWKRSFFSRFWVRPLLLAAIGVAVVVFVGSFVVVKNPPTWAEVQQRFASMPFFAATIYRRDVDVVERDINTNPFIEPTLVELWAGYGNRIRIRSGSQVTFVEKGRILNTFDVVTRSEAYADSTTYAILNSLGKSDTISLESFFMKENPFASEHIPGWVPKEYYSREWVSGGLVDTTARVISDAAVSKDVVVFDHEISYVKWPYARARVWALRETMLPIRIVFWVMDNSKEGRLLPSPKYDLIFTYSKEQPKEFFDPQVFAAKLKDPAVSIWSLLYMFYQYPGGNPALGSWFTPSSSQPRGGS